MQPLERWFPDPRTARVPVRLQEILPGGSALAVLVLFAVMTGALGMPAVLLAAPALLLVVFCGAVALRGRGSDLLVADVTFDLTADSVRVRMGDAIREVNLDRLDGVKVLPVGKAGVGHVVLHESGTPPGLPPAIPTGRRVQIGAVGFAVWATSQDIDPAEQLGDGAMTLWFVPHAKQVRARIEAAIQQAAPHPRGAHR